MSGSVVLSVPTVVPTGWFSATLEGESAMLVGAWFRLSTLTVSASSTYRPPWSVERTRML